jgi:energy-coupling factor transport system permease protein
VTVRFAPHAWLIWAATASILALILRNPLYLVIILLAAQLVALVWTPKDTGLQLSFGRLALTIFLFSILFNLLTVHLGQTVLLRLPAGWWIIGGPITLEAIIYGALSALILVTLLSIYQAFQGVMPASELIGVAPGALQSVGLVVIIAMTYVPQTTRQLQRVKEAQEIRGQAWRGLRDARPIMIPLLIGGLERAMNVAETMVARGYGSIGDRPGDMRIRAGMVIALFVCLGGWALTFWRPWPGRLALGIGVAAIAILYRQLGQKAPRTRYFPRSWTRWDSLFACLTLLPLAMVAASPYLFATHNLFYTPYPLATWPPFDARQGAAIALLAFPALAAAMMNEFQEPGHDSRS